MKPDTITFNAVLDGWARSGDRMAPHRAEQILDHMDELYRAGNKGVKPDTYTYNTVSCFCCCFLHSYLLINPPKLTRLSLLRLLMHGLSVQSEAQQKERNVS